ncbi:MAG: DUF5655 domain-containing protein [Chroococcales cyanobacterium]
MSVESATSRYKEYLQGDNLQLFEIIRKRILNLDSSVREESKKHYIAYKTTTNFVDIVPLKSRLDLYLNMSFEEVNDPKGLWVDVTHKGHWGNGNVQVNVSSLDSLDYVINLVYQAFHKHSDEV